jgi:outer membrane protein insertion porin family
MRTLAVCLGALSLVCFSPGLLSGETPAPPVSEVTVWVDGRPAPENIAGLISIRPGDPFSLKNVSACIKQIYQTGLFSDIRVERSGEDRIALRFVLARKLLIRNIRFRGQTGTSARRLRNALYSLREDSDYSEERLERAREELLRALNAAGYFHPRVETTWTRKPQAPEVDVVFSVQAGVRARVGSIEIVGGGVVSSDDLRREMKIREGDEYVPLDFEADLERLRRLYSRLGYRRAEVELADERLDDRLGTVDLTLRINPGERIEIVIQGADVPRRLVEPIWEERIFEEWGVNEGEVRILSYLREKGFIFASIQSSIERANSVIRVIHSVSPGRKYRIRAVRFDGLRHFSESGLKQKLGLPERILFWGTVDGKRIFELPREIKAIFQAEGFPDIRIALNFIPGNGNATAVYEIDEGKRDLIGSISIEGASLLTPETLRSRLSLVEGGPYFAPEIQREVGKLEAFYLDQGVRGTRIESRAEALEDGLFRVRFLIAEGEAVKIQNLIITGNQVTRRSAIMRELEIGEGDPALAERIQASRRNLEKLGVFSEVKVEEIPVSRGEENLIISVREGERNYASLGVGLETKSEPWTSALFDADLRLRGTAEFMRSNMLGRAASLSFVSQFSLAEKRAVVSWEQPYFLFHFPLQSYLNAWVEEEDRESFGFEREGLSLTGIRSIFSGLTLLTTLRYSRTTLTYLEVTPSEIDRQFYPYSATSFSASVIREKRNDAFNPERGYFASLSLEWAFPLFQTESDFLKGVLKIQRFYPLAPKLNLNSTFRFGLGMGRMPIHERFFAGGSNSFRGQEFDELGPRDPASNNPVGGKALLLFNLEAAFPVFSALPALSAAVFYDTGKIFFNRSDFSLQDLEHALGFGVRYRTPLGPVRLELGWNLTDPERKGKPIAFITIGHVF